VKPSIFFPSVTAFSSSTATEAATPRATFFALLPSCVDSLTWTRPAACCRTAVTVTVPFRNRKDGCLYSLPRWVGLIVGIPFRMRFDMLFI